MAHLVRYFVGGLLIFLLSACGTMGFGSESEAVETMIAATVRAGLTETQSASMTETARPTATSTPTPTKTPTPTATWPFIADPYGCEYRDYTGYRHCYPHELCTDPLYASYFPNPVPCDPLDYPGRGRLTHVCWPQVCPEGGEFIYCVPGCFLAPYSNTFKPLAVLDLAVPLNLICRSGPSMDRSVDSYLAEGQLIQAVGKDHASHWLLLSRGDGSRYCWAHKDNFDVDEEDLVELPVYFAEPLVVSSPTPEPGPACRSTMAEAECVAAGGTWVPGPGQPAHCECP